MGRTSVAVARPGDKDALRAIRLEGRDKQAERLIPAIGVLMAEAELAFDALDRIAVSVGPGGFSGIRAGVAAARGIALAAGVPVVGATSFAIMAASFEATEGCPDTYGLVSPAGVGAHYCQLFRRDCVPLSEIMLLPAEAVEPFFAKSAQAIAGPSAQALAGQGKLPVAAAAVDIFPDAEVLARLAASLDPLGIRPRPSMCARPTRDRRQTP